MLHQVAPRITGGHMDRVLVKDSLTCHHLGIMVLLFQGEDRDVQIQIWNRDKDHVWSPRVITLAIDQCSVGKWPREVKVIMKTWSHLPIAHYRIKDHRHKQLTPNKRRMTRRIRRNSCNHLHPLKELKEMRRVKNLPKYHLRMPRGRSRLAFLQGMLNRSNHNNRLLILQTMEDPPKWLQVIAEIKTLPKNLQFAFRTRKMQIKC